MGSGLRRLLTAVATAIAFTTLAPGAWATPSDEATFVELINQSRSSAGLGPLAVYADLVDDARAHTAEMITAKTIFHSTTAQLSAVTSGWSLLGENVGMGPEVGLLHTAFMNSPSHKANILGTFDRVGVGADRAPNGTLFVTVIFMQSADQPAPPATTTTTAPPPTTTTTTTTTTAPPPTTTSTTTSPPTTTVRPTPTNTVTTASPDDQAVSRSLAPRVKRAPGVSRTLGFDLTVSRRFAPGRLCIRPYPAGGVCVE